MKDMEKNNFKTDILEFLSNLSNDEVFTSPKMVNIMLDMFPNEIWKNKNLKFLDPCCKTGIFLREIAKRLDKGLEDEINDKQDRLNHIYKNMLYGISGTYLTHLLTKRTLYCSKSANSEFSLIKFENEDGNIIYNNIEHSYKEGKCIYCGASKDKMKERSLEDNELYAYMFIHGKKINNIFKDKNMKFDVIIGNPPYQLKSGGYGAQATPIYNLFIEDAKKLNPKYMSFIIPSRWFSGGMGLDKFREDMLNDSRILEIHDHKDATECFPGVQIEGGVCYFLWDRDKKDFETKVVNHKGQTEDVMYRKLNEYEIFIRENKSISILKKVLSKTDFFYDGVKSNAFKMATNFSSFDDAGEIIVYANKKKALINKEKILKNTDLIDKYKVLISEAYGLSKDQKQKIIGKPIITEKYSACTATYLVCGAFDLIEDATLLSNYLKTKFVRFLIGLKKNTQHTNNSSFMFVPKLDFTLNEINDEYLFKKYELSKEEIELIESLIREMD